jgi:carboxymethylenebutenolidase
MGVSTRTEMIAMPDGGQMAAYVAVPESRSGPGMLTLMEIFGVGDYIREAAERLAGIGYVALAPDLYRRTRPGTAFGHGEGELEKAFAAAGELDAEGAVADATVALDHLRGVPEVVGDAGALGFCLGGTLACAVALAADPAVAVCYYGSGVPDMLDQADRIACPVLMHWGAEDPFIPLEQAQRACRAAEPRADWACHIHPDGGHAFDNWDSDFSRPAPAAAAWEQTRAFLASSLPV